jgi:hypothetical protein
MKQAAIAAVIERDLLRADTKPETNIVECWSCGRTYRYKRGEHALNAKRERVPLGGNFCSLRCRDWYDAGNPALHQDWLQPKIVYRWRDGRPMKMGPHGFLINCANCGQEFDSKGLRCCSTKCERRYRDRQDNLAVMAEVGIEAAPKRQCANCGQTIPKWRNGRRVRSDQRFCSPKCRSRCQTAETAETSR